MSDKINILGTIALISFLAILFTPKNTEVYKIPLMIGIGFGALWFFKK